MSAKAGFDAGPELGLFGVESAIFDTEKDRVRNFMRIAVMLATQKVHLILSQWFNTRSHWAYGIDGAVYRAPFTYLSSKTWQAS